MNACIPSTGGWDMSSSSYCNVLVITGTGRGAGQAVFELLGPRPPRKPSKIDLERTLLVGCGFGDIRLAASGVKEMMIHRPR